MTQDQVDSFNKLGYLVLPSVFDEDEIAAFRREADFILELIINSSICNERHSRRLDLRLNRGKYVVRKIQPINDLSLVLSKASNDERLIGPLKSLMMDDPILMEEKLNYKQQLDQHPRHLVPLDQDDRFPIHNDWAYYRAQNYPQDILSSAITIDEMSPDAGPIRVWPGTHQSYLEHEIHAPFKDRPGFKELVVVPELIDRDAGVDLCAPAGSVLLFHTLLVHSSTANESGRPRRLMIYSHYPKKANKGTDVRNGPTRLRESPHELEYLRTKASGGYVDLFSIAS